MAAFSNRSRLLAFPQEASPAQNNLTIDYEGFGRLREQIKSTRIVTGEHVYTRYGFRQLLDHHAAEIWQPDINWCGGLTELRRIGALAAAYDIPVILHGGGRHDGVHYLMANPGSPWAEMFMPAPGGPDIVYERYEQDYRLTRGPEGIYTRPSERPGFGQEIEVVGWLRRFRGPGTRTRYGLGGLAARASVPPHPVPQRRKGQSRTREGAVEAARYIGRRVSTSSRSTW